VAPPGNQAANGENKPQPKASEETCLLDNSFAWVREIASSGWRELETRYNNGDYRISDRPLSRVVGHPVQREPRSISSNARSLSPTPEQTLELAPMPERIDRSAPAVSQPSAAPRSRCPATAYAQPSTDIWNIASGRFGLWCALGLSNCFVKHSSFLIRPRASLPRRRVCRSRYREVVLITSTRSARSLCAGETV
jgi:hypothetical protein